MMLAGVGMMVVVAREGLVSCQAEVAGGPGEGVVVAVLEVERPLGLSADLR